MSDNPEGASVLVYRSILAAARKLAKKQRGSALVADTDLWTSLQHLNQQHGQHGAPGWIDRAEALAKLPDLLGFKPDAIRKRLDWMCKVGRFCRAREQTDGRTIIDISSVNRVAESLGTDRGFAYEVPLHLWADRGGRRSLLVMISVEEEGVKQDREAARQLALEGKVAEAGPLRQKPQRRIEHPWVSHAKLSKLTGASENTNRAHIRQAGLAVRANTVVRAAAPKFGEELEPGEYVAGGEVRRRAPNAIERPIEITQRGWLQAMKHREKVRSELQLAELPGPANQQRKRMVSVFEDDVERAKRNLHRSQNIADYRHSRAHHRYYAEWSVETAEQNRAMFEREGGASGVALVHFASARCRRVLGVGGPEDNEPVDDIAHMLEGGMSVQPAGDTLSLSRGAAAEDQLRVPDRKARAAPPGCLLGSELSWVDAEEAHEPMDGDDEGSDCLPVPDPEPGERVGQPTSLGWDGIGPGVRTRRSRCAPSSSPLAPRFSGLEAGDSSLVRGVEAGDGVRHRRCTEPGDIESRMRLLLVRTRSEHTDASPGPDMSWYPGPEDEAYNDVETRKRSLQVRTRASDTDAPPDPEVFSLDFDVPDWPEIEDDDR